MLTERVGIDKTRFLEAKAMTPGARHFTRDESILASRVVICVTVFLSLGSYFLQPVGLVLSVLDVLFRAYLHFVCGSMAHEGTHGHLGKTRFANLWWGRIALIPTTVPFATFRLSHLSHHSHTNVPGKDPDEYLNTANLWQLPFRILAMPHQWVVWLRKQGKFGGKEMFEYFCNYLAYFIIYAGIATFVGWERVVFGLFPTVIVHSFLLWIPFAKKTHEGYSTGSAESRSHEYYGKLVYWFSFGLSVHRLHHMKPGMGWLEMSPHVQPGTWSQVLTLKRDVRT